jgi:signal transduction histidine kinase
VVVLAIVALTVASAVHPSLTVVVVDDVCKAALAFFACIFCSSAAIRGQKYLQIAWGFFAISTFVWGGGAVVECVISLINGSPSQSGTTSWADIVFIGAIAFGIFALDRTTSLAEAIRQQNLRLGGVVEERTTVLAESLETLHQANDERRRLLLRLVTSQDTEKRQIAQIIHDDMLQSVATAQLHLYTLRKKAVPDEIKLTLEKVDSSITESATALRGLTIDLSLQELDLGFAEAIQRCVDRELEAGVVNIEVLNDVDGDPDRQVAAAIYRNLREALVNVRKHAPGAHVIVMISSAPDQYILNVSDDGPGFEAGGGESPHGHLGLTSMRERAEALGGSMHIGSETGKGTVLEFYIPRNVRDDVSDEKIARSMSRTL